MTSSHLYDRDISFPVQKKKNITVIRLLTDGWAGRRTRSSLIMQRKYGTVPAGFQLQRGRRVPAGTVIYFFENGNGFRIGDRLRHSVNRFDE